MERKNFNKLNEELNRLYDISLKEWNENDISTRSNTKTHWKSVYKARQEDALKHMKEYMKEVFKNLRDERNYNGN